MNRDIMKRRTRVARVVREIEAYKMSNYKPCYTAIKQKNHKPFQCDFQSRNTESKSPITYLSEKCNIKEQIPCDKHQ